MPLKRFQSSSSIPFRLAESGFNQQGFQGQSIIINLITFTNVFILDDSQQATLFALPLRGLALLPP
jgi:hypothetical protein